MGKLKNEHKLEFPEVEFVNVNKTFQQQGETLQVLNESVGKVEKGSISNDNRTIWFRKKHDYLAV